MDTRLLNILRAKILPEQGQHCGFSATSHAGKDFNFKITTRLIGSTRLEAAHSHLELANGSANQKPDDNPAFRALKEFQLAMAGEAERAGIMSEDDVVALVMAGRKSH